MLTVIRKNQQVLMLVIAIMTIIAFIWLYNPTDKFHKFGSNDVVSIYGRVVQRAQIDYQVRGYQLALALGLTDFVRDLGGLGGSEETSISDFILNLFVIQHQAPEMGINLSSGRGTGAFTRRVCNWALGGQRGGAKPGTAPYARNSSCLFTPGGRFSLRHFSCRSRVTL